jgi:hypothetical protein
MTSHKRFISLALLLIATCSSTFAQEIKKPALHPGDTIQYEIHLEGRDAAKLKQAIISLQLKTPQQADQSVFVTSFGSGHQEPFSPGGIVHAQIKIPELAATGDYYLAVEVYGDGFQYAYNESDLSVPLIHVVNDEHFEKPKITVKQLP